MIFRDMKNNVLDNNALRSCTSCGICASVCGTNAISLEHDSDGFYRPVINDARCVDCGLCKKSCYKYDNEFKLADTALACYAAWNNDADQLARSSSGGMSRLLMEECIARGYKVFGCTYDLASNKAKSIVVGSVDDLDQFYGSKYFQSYTPEAFVEILKDSTDQKYAIFGTPCQIYAFSQTNKYKRYPEKYFLVDIFCHGCPSVKLWDVYRKNKEVQTGVNRFDSIAFRSKTYGWHEYSIDFKTTASKVSSKKINDPFFDLFFGGDVMNMACYDCQARSTMAYTDIRIGDYWGPKYEMNTKGVSAVIVRSELGKEIFSYISDKMTIEPAEFANIIAAQSYGKVVKFSEQRRNYLLRALEGEADASKVAAKYRSMLPLKRRVKLYLKSLVKKLPGGISFRVRKILHSI